MSVERQNVEGLHQLSRSVIGAAITVHSRLGPGLVESVYEAAMGWELGIGGIPFERQKVIPVTYRSHVVGEMRVDLLVDRRLIVEVKSVQATLRAPQDTATYLSARHTTSPRSPP